MTDGILAVLFDLDGLLSDTERWHRQAYRDVLGAYGVALDDALYEDHWIRHGRGIAEFIALKGLDLSDDDIRGRKAARYHELVRERAEPMPGARAALERFRGVKRLALASSSYRDALDAVVETLGFGRYFDTVVSRDDVQRVKPHPDIFLRAAERLGVPAASCVVLEDAEKGIAAAAAAGMASIAVPNEHTRGNDFSKATHVVGSLDAVTLELVESCGDGVEA